MLTIAGMVQILLFQGLGEVISRWLIPSLPGPVIGLVLLLAVLLIRGRVDPALEFVAAGFSQNLGLLFVPAAVGVVLFLPQLQASWLAVSAALVVSVVATLAVTAIVLRLFDRHSEEPPSAAMSDHDSRSDPGSTASVARRARQ